MVMAVDSGDEDGEDSNSSSCVVSYNSSYNSSDMFCNTAGLSRLIWPSTDSVVARTTGVLRQPKDDAEEGNDRDSNEGVADAPEYLSHDDAENDDRDAGCGAVLFASCPEYESLDIGQCLLLIDVEGFVMAVVVLGLHLRATLATLASCCSLE